MDWLWDLLARQWADLLARPSGPFAFRFVLQPVMATIVGIREGLNDARTGRAPYLWSMVTGARERKGLLREGLRATGRIILLGLAMDAAYQIVVLKMFYPAEALVVALGLAFVPYVLIRGPITRLARWWRAAPDRGDGRRSGSTQKDPRV